MKEYMVKRMGIREETRRKEISKTEREERETKERVVWRGKGGRTEKKAKHMECGRREERSKWWERERERRAVELKKKREI